MYISHLRSEGSFFIEGLEELLTIAREANIRAEIYHLKAAGRPNWHKMDEVIRRVDEARRGGMEITADMYLYPAGGTGLNACLPPWVHDGGDAALLARIKDPATRERIKQEMNTPSDKWENMWQEVDSPDRILLAGFATDALKPLTGKTLAQVAVMRGTSPEDTLFDLLLEDGGRIFTMYFMMSEENIRKQVQLDWVSFCSDAESMSPEGVFLKSNPHPRAYGNFARLLGHYVRDEGLVTLQEAVRRLTSFPAHMLRIQERGALQPGHFADVVVFDPAQVRDHATFDAPHQFSTGMVHVFVNGVQVLKDGEHTGAKPGQVVRGPGWVSQ
jgi:N-acyl-D-amino-acid deacylase